MPIIKQLKPFEKGYPSMKEARTLVRFNLLGDCRKPALYVIFFITLSCSKQRVAGWYNIHPASYMFSMLQKRI